jgi:two-component system cell cycle response regulator
MSKIYPQRPKRIGATLVESSENKKEITEPVNLTAMAEEVLQADKNKKKAHLVILSGQDVGRSIVLEDQTVVIGRDPKCDEVLPDEGISRRHVKIERNEKSAYFLEDLKSTNGTFIQGERIKRCRLSDGDKVLLGRRTMLKFMYQDDIEETYFKEMYDSSTRDGLTGIFNRKYLIEKIAADLSFAKRHRIPISLLMFDIDQFKKVNDTHGHQTGDLALVVMVKTITNIIRAEDTFARYGGEEFTIIAQGTDLDGAKVLAERIRKHVAEKTMSPERDQGVSFRITVSIGVAALRPSAETDPDGFVAAADENLYRAKKNGRNQVVASLVE